MNAVLKKIRMDTYDTLIFPQFVILYVWMHPEGKRRKGWEGGGDQGGVDLLARKVKEKPSRSKFSKVKFILNVLYEMTRKLTFEKICFHADGSVGWKP